MSVCWIASLDLIPFKADPKQRHKYHVFVSRRQIGQTMKHESDEQSLRDAAATICQRLEDDYARKFAHAGGSGLDAWANAAQIGVETRFGGRVGPVWATNVRYRRRTGWLGLFGPWVQVRTLSETEHLLRDEIEEALAKMKSGLRPHIFGRGPRWS